MIFNYKILEFRPQDNFVKIEYSTSGKNNIIRGFSLPNTINNANKQTIVESIAVAGVPSVQWDKQDILDTVSDTDVDIGILSPNITYPPPAQAIPELTNEEKFDASYREVLNDRRMKEIGGTSWSDGSDSFYIATDESSQTKFASARIGVDSSMRSGGIWKMGLVNIDQSVSPIYRETSNVEMNQITQIVFDHVQKCFDAEKVAMEKVVAFYTAGDIASMEAVSYNDEFLALP